MWYAYRKSSGEVLGMSEAPWGFAENPAHEGSATYVGEVENPNEMNGSGLDPKKIFIPVGSILRNATGPEIAAFASLAAIDENLAARAIAKDAIEGDVVMRKFYRALIETLLDELNTLRALHALPLRTLTQARNAIQAKIDSGVHD